MKTWILFALALGLAPGNARSNEAPATQAVPAAPLPERAPQEDPPLSVFSFITKIPGDFAATAKSLTRHEAIVPWLVVTGSTLGLIKYDYELWQPFHDWHYKNKVFHDVTEFGWNVGKGGFQFGIAGGFLAMGAIWGNHRALRTASQIVEVVIVTGITTQIMKHIAGRESPSVATDVQTGRWHVFPNPAKYSRRVSAFDAFPSGHIATSFATEQVIERNYPEQTWIPYLGYPIVGFVAVSMVATNGHWWSDYPLSLLLGYHFAKAVTRGNAPHEELPTAWHVDPYIPVPGAAGVMVGKSF